MAITNKARNSLNDEERRLWILNDEGLYNWWKSSHKSVRSFIRENRAELTEVIMKALHRYDKVNS